ncbi:hypothetical protein AAUPMC_04424 [Pasteurella multocida subsp. multocida str. Anand1_cattle]|nr:hypothetical protein AAUPMC_04424 [Pasteurella multocida subsp. multocida str. Anand1_cattle]
MALILNILNFVLGGFATTLGWLLATLVSALLIVTLPYTRSCWELAKCPSCHFGNDIIHVNTLNQRMLLAIPWARY